MYGHYRVISQHASNGALRVLVEDTRTGERSYRVIPL